MLLDTTDDPAIGRECFRRLMSAGVWAYFIKHDALGLGLQRSRRKMALGGQQV